jgi:hypothetical protein
MDKNTAGIIQALSDHLIYTEIKLRALDSLLVDNKIATEDEIKKTCEAIHERDFEKIKKELLNSFEVNAKNY